MLTASERMATPIALAVCRDDLFSWLGWVNLRLRPSEAFCTERQPTAFFNFPDFSGLSDQKSDRNDNSQQNGNDGGFKYPYKQPPGTHPSYNAHPREVEPLDPDSWIAAYNAKWYMMWGTVAGAAAIALTAVYFRFIRRKHGHDSDDDSTTDYSRHAKPTYYDLPNEGFVYGKSEGADPEGAKEITMTWKSHTPNALPETNVLDFRSLNKSAIDDGKCVNAHSQKVYREQHPKFLVHKSGSKKQHSGDAVGARHHEPMPANFVYGKKTRPSTPISCVISNQFGLESEMVVEARYEEMAEAEEKAKTHCQLKIKSTKAAKGHAAVGKSAHHKHVIGESDKAELFKLSKFKTVSVNKAILAMTFAR
ncbi:hypothetical protein FOL47_008463 [Perkinsus chesapeaki]|uniref:Uncharacterized protein n=1 Tax=Perkinsus chesapeaki TaxID=330153 RepID=A0A7J6LDW0_PERCH|nr:hypothetical protein FOL47_008463 [Perkinsus chesapeaki]